ncbi:vesicle-fusing ATPase [Exophiala viscosa]|uniref:Vesicle-fusing ATPase n=1 Tax=Exophiala viscosa TaxID=2486360 RepID=A0AAN6DU75_9EURO|nr:vesicle-fusing ATPase [Exophiala viscosa]
MDTPEYINAPKEASNEVSKTFFQNASAPRVSTDAALFNAIQKEHPSVPITVVPDAYANLKSYAAAGHAEIETIRQNDADQKIWPDSLRWTIFLPPARRLGGSNGTLAELTHFESYLYKWNDMSFLVYYAIGRDGVSAYPQTRNQYILGDKAAVQALTIAAGRWSSTVHAEVWVFNRGIWMKDRLLFESVQKSRWEDVILDEDMKLDLLDTVERFFDSQEQYDRLRVPWKRGVIFYGPPGNGKTISIKATMRSLHERKSPVPTLYVKTLISFVPSVYSIEAIFSKARQEAPCYLVFEDLDSVVTDNVRSFFLNAVDGISPNDGIFMIGSTNHLDRLDPGIANRPSRFDRKFFFPNPSYDQRVQYCKYWQRKLSDNKDVEFPDEICEAVAEITEKFSFAYIQEAFVSALLSIVKDKGRHKAVQKHEMEDLEEAWELLEVADGNADQIATALKDKDLEDYVLWRNLKRQIEKLRKELREEK